MDSSALTHDISRDNTGSKDDRHLSAAAGRTARPGEAYLYSPSGVEIVNDPGVAAPVGSTWIPRTTGTKAHRAKRLLVGRLIGDEHVETISTTNQRRVVPISGLVKSYAREDGVATAPARPARTIPVVLAPNPPAEPIAPSPEDMGVRVYVFRDRPCVIAAAVGKALGYADGALAALVRKEWSGELTRERDFEVLESHKLREFKRVVDDPMSNLGSSSRLMVLYETGFDLVLQKTDKPEGAKLRRRLADEVLPKLRRGQAVAPSGAALPAPVPVLDVRSIVVDTIRELVPAIIRETMAALPRTVPVVAPALPAAPETPPKGWDGASGLAKVLTGRMRKPVTRAHVDKAIRALKIREREDVAKRFRVERAADGFVSSVPMWFYSPLVLDGIEAHLEPESPLFGKGGAS